MESRGIRDFIALTTFSTVGILLYQYITKYTLMEANCVAWGEDIDLTIPFPAKTIMVSLNMLKTQQLNESF